MKNKTLFPFLMLILLSIISLACGQTNTKSQNQANESTKISSFQDTLAIDSSATIKDTILVVGVGDMMLGTKYPSNSIYLPPNNDCSSLFKDVNHILQNADVTFGNLEGSLLDEGPVVKRCSDPTKCFAFRMPEKYIHCFKDAGFDVVSLANNHMGDFGDKGRNKTIELLNEAEINFAGLLSKTKDIFTIDGIKYGFCAFSPNTGTSDINKVEEAKKLVSELDAECDIVIVSFHGGAEGASHQHVTKRTETFYGENRGNVYEFAHQMIDAGGDIIFGHGPHVTRAIDIYKKRFIIYSMGNFCTYSRFSLKGPNGIAPIVKVYVNADGEFLKGEIVATYQIKYSGGPKIDPQKRVIKKIQELTKQDLPELSSVLSISDDGLILLK